MSGSVAAVDQTGATEFCVSIVGLTISLPISTPQQLAATFKELDSTTTNCPDPTAIPVRSNTPLPNTGGADTECYRHFNFYMISITYVDV